MVSFPAAAVAKVSLAEKGAKCAERREGQRTLHLRIAVQRGQVGERGRSGSPLPAPLLIDIGRKKSLAIALEFWLAMRSERYICPKETTDADSKGAWGSRHP